MSAAPSPTSLTALLRPIRADDVLACIDVFYEALDDLYGRLDQPPLPREPAALQRLLQHLVDTDAERCWLAEEPSTTVDPTPPRVLGFGAATLREDHWFLSLLYVRPEAQKSGLGRRLLLATFPQGPTWSIADGGPGTAAATRAHEEEATHGSDGPDAADGRGRPGEGTLSTCVDALQPVSTGLYAGYGIVPRVPLFSAVGEPRSGAFPPLPADVETLSFEQLDRAALPEILATLDRAVLGHARPADHAFWLDERRHGMLFRSRATGAPLGYGYTQASGRLGPLTVLDGGLTTAALGVLFGAETPRGAWLALVPGANEPAMVALLRSGFRFEGWPGIVASTREVGFLSRYLPANFALL